MDMYKRYKSALGYELGDDGIDSYGVDHNGFSTRDELAYQFARDKREGKLLDYYQSQGINDNYPQYGTEFWGGSAENNYGFGHSEIKENIDNQPALNQTPFPKRMAQTPQAENNNLRWEKPQGSEYQITMPKPQEVTTWDKLKDWAENTGDAMQAGAVGYATGATLGNFDEAMGTAPAAVTLDPRNYTMGRDAVRRLQNDLNHKYPYIYGGAEALGVTLSGMLTKPALASIIAGIGYADNVRDIPANIEKNAVVARFTNGIQKINVLPKEIRDFGQNAASEYLLNKEKEEK